MSTSEARVAVLESRVSDLDNEVSRIRSRIHQLEAERATVSLLLEQSKSLSLQVRDIAAGSEALARRCAREAVDVLMEHRDELAARRSGVSIGWIAAAVALATFLSNAITHLWK